MRAPGFRHTALCAFLALALIAPLAAAATPIELNAQSSGIQTTQSTLQSSLLALVESCQPGAPAVPRDLVLDATRARVETDQNNAAILGGAIKGPPTTSGPSIYQNAHITSTRIGDACRLLVFPLDGSPTPAVSFDSPCSALAPPGSDQVPPRPPRVQNPALRNNLTATIAGGMKWTDCSPAAPDGSVQSNLIIQGNFRMVLFDLDTHLSSTNQTADLDSGFGTLDPTGTADTSQVAGTMREQYVYLWGATLQIPRISPAAEIYLGGQATARGNSASVLLQQATGTITGAPHARALQATTVEVTGELASAIEAGGSANAPLQGRVTGQASGLEVNGVTVPLTTTPGFMASSWWAAFGALGLGAVLAPTVPVVRRSRRLHRLPPLLARTEDLVTGLRYREAVAVAAKAVDILPTAPRSQFLLAVSLAGAGDAVEARMRHDQVAQLLRRKPDLELEGENAFHAALLAARFAAPAPDVLGLLVKAVRAKPSLLSELEVHREFAPFCGNVWTAVDSGSNLAR